jgi:hypothetical protein
LLITGKRVLYSGIDDDGEENNLTEVLITGGNNISKNVDNGGEGSLAEVLITWKCVV